MAGNNIGNASLTLSSNGSSLASGLDKASKDIKKWSLQNAIVGSSIGASIGQGFKNTGSVFSSLGTLAGSLLGASMGGAIGAALGGSVGEVAGGIVGKLTKALFEPLEKLDLFAGIVKQANTLGVSASQFAGLGLQLKKAGIEGEQLNKLFIEMGRNVTDAAGGHGQAAPAFKQLGINAKELMAMPLDKQFLKIADEVKKLPRGAEQASMAMHLFGGEGAKLLPILQKGSAGLQEFINHARATGLILNDNQMSAAAEAVKAWKDGKRAISDAWDGLANQLSLIAAPLIKTFGEATTKIYDKLGPAFQFLGGIIEKWSVIIDAAFEKLGEWIDNSLNGIDGLADGFDGLSVSSDRAGQVGFNSLKNISVMGAKAFDWTTDATGLLWAFSGALSKILAVCVRSLITAASVMTQALEGILPPEWGLNWAKNQVKIFDEWADHFDRTGDEMLAKGGGMMHDAVLNPAVGNVNKFFDGVEHRQRRLAKNADEIKQKTDDTAKYEGVAAAIQGSKEAYSIESKFRFDSDNTNKIQEKQLEETKKMRAAIDLLVKGSNAPALKLIAG